MPAWPSSSPSSRASGPNAPELSTRRLGARSFWFREMLLRGEVARGERISELPLVARLGMSRTPIRLALERLAQSACSKCARAVQGPRVHAGRGARRRSKCAASSKARPRASPRSAWATVGTRSRAPTTRPDGRLEPPDGDSFAEYMDANEAFHSAVLDSPRARCSAARIELTTRCRLRRRARWYFRPRSCRVGRNARDRQEHHRAILEAIATRQGARAGSLAREHALLSGGCSTCIRRPRGARPSSGRIVANLQDVKRPTCACMQIFGFASRI